MNLNLNQKINTKIRFNVPSVHTLFRIKKYNINDHGIAPAVASSTPVSQMIYEIESDVSYITSILFIKFSFLFVKFHIAFWLKQN